MKKGILLSTWLCVALSVAVISSNYAGESMEFLGIADDQEQTIRFARSVEIVSYGFVPGQEVSAGELIVEVRQPTLNTELKVVRERIHALHFDNRERRAAMEAEIVQLQADLQARLVELDSGVRSLRARKRATQGLMDKLQVGGKQTADSAVEMEIKDLELRKRALRRATSARVDDLESRLSSSDRPIESQIAELEKQHEGLSQQREDMKVQAQLNGRVGSVLFKVGDTVPPFQPILTIHGSRPSFVKGYIHESVLNHVQLGQIVWVRSASSMSADVWHEGTVESLGSRIVEFPTRLMINKVSQAWGREVVVVVGSEHSLLLGEKVNIQLRQPTTFIGKLSGWLGGEQS